MKHSVPHDLGQERAKKVTEQALGSYATKFAKYAPKTTWTSPSTAKISFSVKGMTLNGAVEIKDKSIDMELDDHNTDRRTAIRPRFPRCPERAAAQRSAEATLPPRSKAPARDDDIGVSADDLDMDDVRRDESRVSKEARQAARERETS